MVTGAEGLHNQRAHDRRHPQPAQPFRRLERNPQPAQPLRRLERLPGTYQTFQDAREMVEFIHSSYGPDAFFAIEHSYDIIRKGYVIAA
jgi:hypothetical protein